MKIGGLYTNRRSVRSRKGTVTRISQCQSHLNGSFQHVPTNVGQIVR